MITPHVSPQGSFQKGNLRLLAAIWGQGVNRRQKPNVTKHRALICVWGELALLNGLLFTVYSVAPGDGNMYAVKSWKLQFFWLPSDDQLSLLSASMAVLS